MLIENVFVICTILISTWYGAVWHCCVTYRYVVYVHLCECVCLRWFKYHVCVVVCVIDATRTIVICLSVCMCVWKRESDWDGEAASRFAWVCWLIVCKDRTNENQMEKQQVKSCVCLGTCVCVWECERVSVYMWKCLQLQWWPNALALSRPIQYWRTQ